MRRALGQTDLAGARSGRGDPAVERAQRAAHHGRAGEELGEVGSTVAPVAARVHPEAREATLVGPGADRVDVHAQESGGAAHGQGAGLGVHRAGCGLRS